MTLEFRGALEALSFQPDLGGRNDFRNMINCPAVAFRRRRRLPNRPRAPVDTFCRCVSARGMPRDSAADRFQIFVVPSHTRRGGRGERRRIPKSKASRLTVPPEGDGDCYQAGDLINHCRPSQPRR